MSASLGTTAITVLVLNLPQVNGDYRPAPGPGLPGAPPPVAVQFGAPADGLPELPSLLDPPLPYDPAHWRADLVPDASYRELLSQAAGETSRYEPSSLEAGRRRVQEAMLSFDPNLRSHSMRVALLAGSIARQLGLSEEQARDVEWGASVHDVGKEAPRILEIVNSTDRLTPEQRRVVVTHTIRGAKLLSRRPELDARSRRAAVEAALNHHERMDGTGYPRGIAGDKIPLVARIVHVADYYDALMENRPYRPGMTRREALATMLGVSQEFDPDALHAFLAFVAPIQ